MPRIQPRTWACLIALVVFASCTGDAGPRPEASGSTVASGDAEDCPVTVPNGDSPPGEYPYPDRHGNGELWVTLPGEEGIIDVTDHNVQPDGSIAVKFPWYRAVKEELSITGRRLDGSAPPVRADIPSGYSITGFQASGIIFPGPGCWKVTGEVGSSSLTFVTLVSDPCHDEGTCFHDEDHYS